MTGIRQLVVNAITFVQTAHDRRLCTLIEKIKGMRYIDSEDMVDELAQLRRDMLEDTEVFLASARDTN